MSIIAFLLVLLFALPAFAADAAAGEVSALADLINVVVQIAAGVLIVLFTWGGKRVLGWVQDKTSFDISARQEAQVNQWVIEGINMAEKKAEAAIKRNVTFSGPEKLETAVNHVIDFAESKGWVEWSRDRVARKVEAMLGASTEKGVK